MGQLPKTPKAKRDLPEPFKAGDPVLDRRDMTASTNHIPGISHKDSQGMSRGITRREDRDHWTGGKGYNKMVSGEIARGRDEHARRVGRSR